MRVGLLHRALFLLIAGALACAYALPARYAFAQAEMKSIPGDTLRLGLDKAIELALINNEDIHIATSYLDKAHGQKREAYASALPHVNFYAGYTRNILRPVLFFSDPEAGETIQIEIGEENDYAMNVSMSQVLFAFGRVGGAIKAAQYYIESAEQTVEATRRGTILSVQAAYYQAVLAKEVLNISRLSLQQAQKHFVETGKKMRMQVASRFDSIRAEVQVKNREPEVIQAENAVKIALMDLKRLVGIERNVPVVLINKLRYEAAEYSVEKAIEDAYQIRPDIAALQLQVKMAEKIHHVTKRNNYPYLSLFGNYSLQGQQSDQLFPDRNRFASSLGAGISLTFPLFDGFANRGRVAQAQADISAAQYTLKKMKKNVALQIQELFDLLRAEDENLQSQAATVAMAEEAYRLALVRFTNGLSTSLELEDTELALTSARLNQLQAIYRYVMTKESLENAMGH